MATLKELLAQQDTIAKQIEALRQTERTDAIAKAKELIAANALTKDDLFGSARETKKVKMKISKVAAKYRDPVSGSQWSGRGIAPKWFDKADKAKFLIA